MTHIAFVNMPAHGHVNPTLAVVEELKKRGIRVTYALTEEYRAAVTRVGAELKSYESQFFANPPTLSFPPDPEEIALMPLKLLNEAAFILPQLERQYRDDRPDLICYDFMAMGGQLLAQKLGVPAVRLNPSYAGNEHFSLAKRFFVSDPNHPAVKEFVARFAEVVAEHELPALKPQDFMTTVEPFNLVFLPRAFQYEGDTFDERFLFVGPCLRPEESDGEWRAPSNDLPVLLISLGTVFNNWPEFFKICIQAFGEKPWNVVMSIGSKVDVASLGTLPSNFDVRAHVPQLSVLKKARVFITHGGMNSTMEGLLNGVPLVAIPQMGEQEATARRLAELNLGRYLPRPEVTVETLIHAVTDVAADAEVPTNIQAMQAHIRAAGGAKVAAEGLLKYLA